MAVATISPARRFPKKSTKMKMTISAPSKRFFSIGMGIKEIAARVDLIKREKAAVETVVAQYAKV